MFPMIALLNIISNNQLQGEEKEIIIIMVTVARLIFAKNWKNTNQYNIEEWYKEMWNFNDH